MVLLQTIISTPTKNYTVLEQKQLMLDMGDIGGVSNGGSSTRLSLHMNRLKSFAAVLQCVLAMLCWFSGACASGRRQ